MRDAIINILRGIPFIGPYIVVIKLKWGWTGILLLIGGLMIATFLVFVGLWPEWLVSERYKEIMKERPPEAKEYEIKSQEEIQWDAAIKNARVRVWVSGVALTKFNPQIIAGKVKEGITARIVYVNPCGAMISRRQVDENNPNAASNIKTNLNRFDTYTKDFNETEKRDLEVKLTDVYPTMVVAIIDDDLYAYFCPHGAVCSTSPVLVFRGYSQKKPENPAARFFEDHFKRVSTEAKPIAKYREPCTPPTSSSP